MPVIGLISAWFSLAVIAATGLHLLLARTERRRESGGEPRFLSAEVDPATLRKRGPRTNRLSGAMLVGAVILLVISLRRALGLT